MPRLVRQQLFSSNTTITIPAAGIVKEFNYSIASNNSYRVIFATIGLQVNYVPYRSCIVDLEIRRTFPGTLEVE
jgi:hypothetical protein